MGPAVRWAALPTAAHLPSWGMGNGEWLRKGRRKKVEGKKYEFLFLPFTFYLLPSQCPIPNAQCPMPNYQLPS